MAFLLRTTVRTVASSSRTTLPVAGITPFVRYASTFPREPNTPSTPRSSELFPSPPRAPPTPQQANRNKSTIGKLTINDLSTSSSAASTPTAASELADPDSWWRRLSADRTNGFPTNTFTGRSIPVSRKGDFLVGYKRLQGLLRNSNLKKELRLAEFHEKPSVRRRRLISERHRRRFKEMVRTKVQQVISMRTRG